MKSRSVIGFKRIAAVRRTRRMLNSSEKFCARSAPNY
jgi:hypothetical protein